MVYVIFHALSRNVFSPNLNLYVWKKKSIEVTCDFKFKKFKCERVLNIKKLSATIIHLTKIKAPTINGFSKIFVNCILNYS